MYLIKIYGLNGEVSPVEALKAFVDKGAVRAATCEDYSLWHAYGSQKRLPLKVATGVLADEGSIEDGFAPLISLDLLVFFAFNLTMVGSAKCVPSRITMQDIYAETSDYAAEVGLIDRSVDHFDEDIISPAGVEILKFAFSQPHLIEGYGALPSLIKAQVAEVNKILWKS